MPRGDAVQSQPSIHDEMAKFQGFSTNNGETVASVADSVEETTAREQRTRADEAAKTAVAAKSKTQGAAPKVTATPAVKVPELVDDEEDEPVDPALTTTADGKTPAEVAKPKKSAQERINEVTRARRAVERDLATEKARNDSLERRLANLEGRPLTADPKAGKQDPTVAPVPADFEYGELDTRYIRALARHEARQELAEASANQNKTRQREAAAQDAQKVSEQRATFDEAGLAKYDDFEEVVIEGARNNDWPLSPELGRLMLESEHGPEIAYALASDVKEARRVFSLSPLAQAAYFGRQEAKLSPEPGAKTPKASATEPQVKAPQAPPPPSSVRGKGAKPPVSPDTTDFAAFEAQAMRRTS